MKNTIVLSFIFFFLASCASINPHNVPEGKGAYLKNRIEFEGKARYSYFFIGAGQKELWPGWTTPGGKAVYKIPPGKMALKLKIVYTPDARPGYALEDQYEIWVLEIDLNALEGQTYQMDCRIEKGRAYIWIEDAGGKKVSETAPGLKAHRPYFLVWKTLPSPVP